MRRAVLGLSLLAMAGFAALFLNPATPASAATVAVKVGDFYFCDLSFQNGVCDTKIDVNDTVRWEFTNSGTFQFHTTTECGASCDAPTATPLWNSGLVGPGPGAPFEHTFTQAGSFLYYCSVHPFSMRGRIIVDGAVGGNTPTNTPTATATNTPMPPPPPLGGSGVYPDVPGSDGSSMPTALVTAIAVATIAAGATTLGGAAWYARRQI